MLKIRPVLNIRLLASLILPFIAYNIHQTNFFIGERIEQTFNIFILLLFTLGCYLLGFPYIALILLIIDGMLYLYYGTNIKILLSNLSQISIKKFIPILIIMAISIIITWLTVRVR